MEQVEFKIKIGRVPKLTGPTEVKDGQEAIKITSDADDSDWTFWAYSTPEAMKKLEQIGVFEVSGVEVHLAYGKPHKGRTVIAYASDYLLGETHDGRFASRAFYIWVPYMWKEGYTPKRNPLSPKPAPKPKPKPVTRAKANDRDSRILAALRTYTGPLRPDGLPKNLGQDGFRVHSGIADVKLKDLRRLEGQP